MSYILMNFKSGDRLTADSLNHMDSQIYTNEANMRKIRDDEIPFIRTLLEQLDTSVHILNNKQDDVPLTEQEVGDILG